MNQLQEVCALLPERVLNLPQLVVIGGQSSGKSSVLENLVGRDFLPRGSGLVTRVPLLLQLVRTEGGDEWGEFSHSGEQRFSFPELRAEIEAQTEKLAGPNPAIADTPILLKIFSPHVLPLTLVDTPGVTRVPVGNQPADIERRLRELVLRYISPPQTLIIAVHAANQDIATSDALNLARQVDPLGERTLGVLTKVDLMDSGTSVVPMIHGHGVSLKLGFVAVVNRGQAAVERHQSIRTALKSEKVV